MRDILSYALPTELSRRIESRLTDEQTYPSTSKGAVEEGEAYLERETPRPLTIESLENHRLANPPIYHMTVSGSISHRIPSSGLRKKLVWSNSHRGGEDQPSDSSSVSEEESSESGTDLD